MSQAQARLFEKWLAAGDDRTFGEWLTEKRERAKALRRPGAVLPVTQSQLAQLQQGSVTFAQLQAAAMQQQYAPRHRIYGGLLGNALGGMFR